MGANTGVEYTQSELVDQQLNHVACLLSDLEHQRLRLKQTLANGVLTPAQRAKAEELLTNLTDMLC